MSKLSCIRTLALFMSALIISLPLVFSEEMHLTLNKNGALITGDGYYREYNEYNQLVKIYNGSSANQNQLLQEYFYHPIDERIVAKKTYQNGNWKETVFYVNPNYVAIENLSGFYRENYLQIDGQLVAQVDADGNKFSVHGDNIGSVSMLVNSQGAVVENNFYDPFGSLIEGGSKSRFDYEGKEFDSVVQDRDFGFRKQNGKLPYLWNQPDTLLPNVFDPQQLNRYSFERNNAYRYTDPDGHLIDIVTVVILSIAFALIFLSVEKSIDNEQPTDYDVAEAALAAGAEEAASHTISENLGNSVAKGMSLNLQFALYIPLSRQDTNYCDFYFCPPEPTTTGIIQTLPCELIDGCKLQNVPILETDSLTGFQNSYSTNVPTLQINLAEVFREVRINGITYYPTVNAVISSDEKSISIGSGGGSHGTITCWVACEVYEGTKEERDRINPQP